MKQTRNQYDIKGNKQGYWEYYQHYGLMISCGNYNNGIKDGEWKSFWQSGGVQEIATFKAGNAVDLQQEFDVKGNITNEIIFIK